MTSILSMLMSCIVYGIPPTPSPDSRRRPETHGRFGEYDPERFCPDHFGLADEAVRGELVLEVVARAP